MKDLVTIKSYFYVYYLNTLIPRTFGSHIVHKFFPCNYNAQKEKQYGGIQ